MNQHPITPSPELIKEWRDQWFESDRVDSSEYAHIATQAARWGADQELEACCEWLQDPDLNVDTDQLRAARRPKPTLSQRALHILGTHGDLSPAEHDTIRRALESLPF